LAVPAFRAGVSGSPASTYAFVNWSFSAISGAIAVHRARSAVLVSPEGVVVDAGAVVEDTEAGVEDTEAGVEEGALVSATTPTTSAARATMAVATTPAVASLLLRGTACA
jgi:hypothetical protein